MFGITIQISTCISFAIDLAPHFMPYCLCQTSDHNTITRSLSLSDLQNSEAMMDQTEWIDYLKVSIDPMDSVASWRYVKNLKNITCKERLENITWRKYSERDKYSLSMLDRGLKSPSTIHLYFSRGFLNGPVVKTNLEVKNVSPKVKRRKKRLLSHKSIRFKEKVDYRLYDSLDDTLLDIAADVENEPTSDHTFGFVEGKERIKNAKEGCTLIHRIFKNVGSKIKNMMLEYVKSKKGVLEFVVGLFFKSSKKMQTKNIPWEPTILPDVYKNPDVANDALERIKKFLTNFYSHSERYFKDSCCAVTRHIHSVTLWTAKKVFDGWKEFYGFILQLNLHLKEKIMNVILTIGNIYSAITSTIRQFFSIIRYVLVISYPYAVYFYQRMKKRISRNVKLAFYVIRRMLSWKKSVVISDLPTEIKWEILKYLDYKSAKRLCRMLKLDEFDCLKYHQFLIEPSVRAPEFGIISFIFTMIRWLFCQPREILSAEVDIWTVGYVIEKMIGTDEQKFSVLVRNEKFRKYVGDEIVLALACKYGEYSIVCQLISDHSNDPSIGMDYALRWAAHKGEAKIIKLLLKDERVDPSIDNNKPLMSACERGHVDVVDALLMHSAVDPGSQFNYAIEKACYNGHKNVVTRLLKDPRVDPTASRNYCLKLACKRNHMDVVQILLSDPRIRPREDDYKMIQRLLQRQNKKNM